MSEDECMNTRNMSHYILPKKWLFFILNKNSFIKVNYCANGNPTFLKNYSLNQQFNVDFHALKKKLKNVILQKGD